MLGWQMHQRSFWQIRRLKRGIVSRLVTSTVECEVFRCSKEIILGRSIHCHREPPTMVSILCKIYSDLPSYASAGSNNESNFLVCHDDDDQLK